MAIAYQEILLKSEEYDALLFGSWGKSNLEYTFLNPSLIPSYYYAPLSPTIPAFWLSLGSPVRVGIAVEETDFKEFSDSQKMQ